MIKYCLFQFVFIVVFSGSISVPAQHGSASGTQSATSINVDDASLVLPDGFKASIVADNLGTARHLVVSPYGDILVKLGKPKNNQGILILHKAAISGKPEKITGFGNYGGTGIAIKNNILYASSDNDVYRYPLNAQGGVVDPLHPEVVAKGLINRRQHETKSIALDNSGNIYVNIGAYSNACQVKDRTKGSAGQTPCPILDSAGGIWKFKADGTNQSYSSGSRFATGLRNVVGLDWNNALNQLFVTQHGRDQLSQLYPQYFTDKQSAELPAETMYALQDGDNCGWPYSYFDPNQQKLVQAPEYGGDGKKVPQESYKLPVAAFPAHMAPNALMFYTGGMFPERYRNGAFVAFHGSWNRAPEVQKGYLVAFVPFSDGKPSGPWEIFADNFAGTTVVNNPGSAAHRPCGLAQGPDGALYVSDDVKGTIYRITYSK